MAWIQHPIDPKIGIPVDVTASGDIQINADALTELDRRYAARPRTGTTQLTEVDSLIEHIKRWGSDATIVYADNAAMAFVAVLDDHPADPTTTAARTHRATYACPRSAEWLCWTALDGKPQGQTQFADFIEARLEDLVGADGMPKPTDVLTVARQLNILTKGTFQREINPTNGDSIFVCKTETDAKSTQIPRAFMLAIPVFDGGVRYQIEARIRFTLIGGVPQFTYVLHRRGETERDAFGEVRAKVGKETGRLVLAGTP
jgi:uncharacterized protein YfdQ (DUF2303 family)